MSNVQRIGVAVVAVALVSLGVFLLTSREAPAPGAGGLAGGGGAAPPVGVVPGPSPAAPPPGPEVVVPAVAAAPGPAPAAGGAGGGGPQVELAPSPFESADSAELQYATKLVLGDATGPAEWRKAAEVFQRCVDQNPTNHLCKRGVFAAWERLDSDGGRPTALVGPMTVTPEALKQVPVRSDGLVAPALQQKQLPLGDQGARDSSPF